MLANLKEQRTRVSGANIFFTSRRLRERSQKPSKTGVANGQKLIPPLPVCCLAGLILFTWALAKRGEAVEEHDREQASAFPRRPGRDWALIASVSGRGSFASVRNDDPQE